MDTHRLLKICLALLLALSPWHEFLVLAWRPLGAWDDLVLLALLALLVAARRWPRSGLTYPLATLWAIVIVSCLVNSTGWRSLRLFLPYSVAALGATQLRSRQDVMDLCRLTLLSATLASLYSIASYLAFRAVGGAYNWRPPVDAPWLDWLLYPYYCGIYPRGWRLCGTFLNDNYFGAWCAALLCLALALYQQRLARLSMVPLLLSWAWTYSRAAVLALLAGLAVLAMRLTPKILFFVPLAVLCSLPFLTTKDLYRFRHPMATEGGRVHSMAVAVEVLRGGSLLGRGPGSRGLADMQYAKIAYELGWLGSLTCAWLAWAILSGLLRRETGQEALLKTGLGSAVLCVAAAGVGGEVLEVPQTALFFWTVSGMLVRLEQPP